MTPAYKKYNIRKEEKRKDKEEEYLRLKAIVDSYFKFYEIPMHNTTNNDQCEHHTNY